MRHFLPPGDYAKKSSWYRFETEIRCIGAHPGKFPGNRIAISVRRRGVKLIDPRAHLSYDSANGRKHAAVNAALSGYGEASLGRDVIGGIHHQKFKIVVGGFFADTGRLH